MKSRRTKAARMMRGWSQHDLAQRAGCSEQTISRVETGRLIPNDGLRARIARELGIAPWEVGQ